MPTILLLDDKACNKYTGLKCLSFHYFVLANIINIVDTMPTILRRLNKSFNRYTGSKFLCFHYFVVTNLIITVDTNAFHFTSL